MCGFAGIINYSGGFDERDIIGMLDKLKHRGPDAQGIWQENGVWLGHRRLSIVDLSGAGSQPMVSPCGRYVISYNGEIYNYKELRLELEERYDIDWSGISDTEVLLQLIVKDGIDNGIKKLNGMFAFALWDREKKELYLARDRFGEKPIFYSMQRGGIVFASELSAIESCSKVKLSVDRDALIEYFEVGYFPAPLSIYREVKKLEPATYLVWKNGLILDKVCYWDIYEKAREGKKNPFKGTEAEAVEKLDNLLTNSVRQRMRSDVPLGAFLSGGIDSSVVVAMMQKLSEKKINTFSIGFDMEKYNEAEHAKEVARQLGTNHTEKYISGKDALDVVPLLAEIYDEPLSDSSFIPTYLVSCLAKEKVTVALTGDGGDELFLGYRRYSSAVQHWNKIRRVPAFIRTILIKVLSSTSTDFLSVLCIPIAVAKRDVKNWSLYGKKIQRKMVFLKAKDFIDIYRLHLISRFNAAELVLDADRPATWQPRQPDMESNLERAAYYDMSNYLVGDILEKVDTAAMAISLEGRIPMLDHAVAEFALSLPTSLKWRVGREKWVLRNVLYKYVRKEIIDRPKMGFGVPLAEWLRFELKDWAEQLLDNKKLGAQGYLNTELIRSEWEMHQSEKADLSSRLWRILMFQLWLERRPQLFAKTGA